ncbi:MAG: hypothetical protein NC094_02380 [Bacteroidales bacterium]|nr:triacylglycerol lipase [Lachnoclostridium sp.]MCM1383397.1 triacylglycerol lipase [Lachnoclostridium sp.]MCM1464245.1 hypothetical protein [Bacteroidales bacterium]
MRYFSRIRCTICVLLMMNILLLNRLISGHVNILIRLALVFFILTAYILTQIFPCQEKHMTLRVRILSGGYELIRSALPAFFLEIMGYLVCLSLWGNLIFPDRSLLLLALTNGLVAWFTLLIHYLNGFWRTCITSSQLGAGLRVLMFFFWWIVPVNLILFVKWCSTVRRELYYERNRHLLDSTRVENAVCRTRYPVVMVHGIFFRDWQFLNYWGRVPQALKKNGAIVYYGSQQSSLSIAASAAEVKAEIERVLRETDAEKVNVVAHSKGGLDTRYVISKLGMADKIASLTTINTPHRGCLFVDALLGSLPDWLIQFTANRYNTLFRKLGDDAPDFLAGIKDLTADACAAFNENVPDSPKVYYQSSMSKMHSANSAGFPLNLGYLLVKKYEGENDGLVSISSAVYGHYLGLVSAGQRGISHGDMIDLTHQNIPGFDVAEFYVQIFAGLKEKGF